LIADAIMKVGKDGILTVEEGKTAETTLNVVEGMQFDRGFVSPFFVTDKERMEGILEDTLIIITTERVSSMPELLPILQKIVEAGKTFLLIADDIDGEALTTLVVNKMQGRLRCIAVKAPGFGDRKRESLEDIASLTGATVISSEVGLKLEQATMEMIGAAKRIVVTKENTTIVGGAGDKKAINERIKSIKTLIDKSESNFDKTKLQERLAKLTSGVAVVEVGAATESELKAKKFKIEDAMHATRAGIEEGIVAGGGVALIRAAHVLKNLFGANPDEHTGIKIIQKAVQGPIRIIAENAGLDGSVVVGKVMEVDNQDYGLNAATGQFSDLIKDGVIDPVKVTRTALQNAASIANLLLTTEVIITNIPEKEKNAQ